MMIDGGQEPRLYLVRCWYMCACFVFWCQSRSVVNIVFRQTETLSTLSNDCIFSLELEPLREEVCSTYRSRTTGMNKLIKLVNHYYLCNDHTDMMWSHVMFSTICMLDMRYDDVRICYFHYSTSTASRSWSLHRRCRRRVTRSLWILCRLLVDKYPGRVALRVVEQDMNGIDEVMMYCDPTFTLWAARTKYQIHGQPTRRHTLLPIILSPVSLA